MNKTNLTFVLGFLMILASAMMVSATLSNDAPSNVPVGTETITIQITENGSSLTGFGQTNNGNISVIGTTVTLSGISDGFSNIIWSVNATDGNVTGSTIGYAFCSNGEASTADSRLNIVDYNVNNLGSGDDEEWQFLDTVEIEVEVENPRNDDIQDVTVDIKVFDSNGNDVTSDFDFDDESIDLGRIKDDDSEIATFVIDKVKVGDLEEGTYKVYIKAYSNDVGEDYVCTENLDSEPYIDFSIVVDLEDNFLVDDSDELSVSCGDTGIPVSFDVWNLGDSKEDKVLVILYNSILGVNEYAVIDNLRGGKSEGVDFVFDMPDYASASHYNLDVFMYYDYDSDDGDDFDENAYGEEVQDNFQIRVNVDSCNAPEPTVSVSTNDAIKVGSEFSFTVDVKNNAADRQDIIVSLSNVDSWAKDLNIEPSVLTLNGGATGTVTITLTPTDAGAHSFSVNTLLGTQTYTQPVSVDVESRFSLGKYFSTDYWEYWVAIGLIVLILIVLIVIIAVVRR